MYLVAPPVSRRPPRRQPVRVRERSGPLAVKPPASVSVPAGPADVIHAVRVDKNANGRIAKQGFVAALAEGRMPRG
eukprot:6816935-Prymnesium_polylepis.1